MNSLEIVKQFIDGIDKYEKQTGRKNTPVYVSKETLEFILKDLEELERYRKVMTPNLQELIQKLEVLDILKEKPFILQRIFENKGLNSESQKKFDKKYFWGTITVDEDRKVLEWLENE